MMRFLPFISPYVAQPDGNTCQSACVAQMLGLEEASVPKVRSDLLGIAARRGTMAGDPGVMGDYLEPRVKEYKFDIAASLNDARKALDDGYKLITHSWATRAGHVISLVGWEPDSNKLSYRFIVDDPWSELDFRSMTYPNPNISGDNVRYSSYGMYAIAVASKSWHDAKRIYKNGELDSAKQGMWLHYIKN